jgi:hypothetical protein
VDLESVGVRSTRGGYSTLYLTYIQISLHICSQ